MRAYDSTADGIAQTEARAITPNWLLLPVGEGWGEGLRFDGTMEFAQQKPVPSRQTGSLSLWERAGVRARELRRDQIRATETGGKQPACASVFSSAAKHHYSPRRSQ